MFFILFLVALFPTHVAGCSGKSRVFSRRNCHHNSDVENNLVIGLGGNRKDIDNDGSNEGSDNKNDNNGCPNGWQRFERARGPWCIGTFYNDKRGNSWSEAQMHCQQHAAVLSGLESLDETNYINQTMGSKWQITLGGVWIGGRRNPACVKPSTSQICANKNTVFEWTDGFTSGTSQYNWLTSTGQPDGLINASNEQQSCIQMWMTKKAYAWRGYLDDQFCDFTYDSNLNVGTFGYVCGKQPEH